MAFHRFSVPTYTGGLPGGYDYINNATSGTPAPADNALGAGTYSGSYFFGQSDQVTGAALNRAAKALAENTDHLDDLIRRDIAVPTIQDFAGGGSPVSSVVLTGPAIFEGKSGTPNTVDGIRTFIQLVDQNDNTIVDASGNECQVTAISGGTVGSGVFSAGNITLTVSPAIPTGIAHRVYFAVRSNLATLPVDAFTNIVIRSAEDVPADLAVPTGAAKIGAAAGPAWADATTNPAGSVQARIDAIITALAGAAGATKVQAPAAAGSPFSLSAATITAQLASLLGNANTNAADISTNAAAIISEASARAAADSTHTTNIAALVTRNYVDVREPGLRLSPHATDPVSELSNLSGSLYYIPYKSGRIDLYDGTGWVPRVTNAVVSLALTTTAATSYDVFAYWTGSAIALELVAFNTDRGLRDGVIVKGSDHTKRYVGSMRSYADGANQVYDAQTDRGVWNMYNQVRRPLRRVESTASWTYVGGSGLWRLARNITNNRVRAIVGIKHPVYVRVHTMAYGSDAAGTTGWGAVVGIGVNSTTINSADHYGGLANHNLYMHIEAMLEDCWFGAGWHTFNWLENTGGREMTFFGSVDGSGDWADFGLSGNVMG